MLKFKDLKILLIVALTSSFTARAQFQENAGMEKQVLSINDKYPVFKTENVTYRDSEKCTCQSNFTFANSNWNSWSKCHGEATRELGCHHGIRVRGRRCSKRRGTNDCYNRQWQYCYHEESCPGHWVVWKDDSKSCRSTHKENLIIRTCEYKGQIGLFCANKQRTPYDITVEPCAEAVFQPNNSTWIAAGAGLLLGMFIVGLLVCVNRDRGQEPETKSSNDSPSKIGKEEATRQQETRKTNTETRNSNPSITQSIASPDTQYYNSTALNSNTLTLKTQVAHFPDPPPVLRHSFFENAPVTSEQAVYSIPSPKNVPVDPWDIQTRDVDVDSYMESSTRFCEERNSITKDHAAPVSYSTDNYMETSSRPETFNPYPSVSRQGSASKNRKYGIPPLGDYDAPTTLLQPETTRDSHVYSEIPQHLQTFR